MRFPSLRHALFRTCLFRTCVFQYLHFQRPQINVYQYDDILHICRANLKDNWGLLFYRYVQEL